MLPLLPWFILGGIIGGVIFTLGYAQGARYERQRAQREIDRLRGFLKTSEKDAREWQRRALQRRAERSTYRPLN